MLYETSKLNKVQLCIDCSHIYKQHLLECVNIPKTVNNSMQLRFVFSISFQSVLHKPTTYLVNATLTNEREYNVVISKSHH